MNSSGDKRQIRVGTRQDRVDYHLRLSVRQFSHRMRAAAIVAGVFFVLLAYVLQLLSLQTGVEFPPVIVTVGYFVAWFFIASMPLLFGLSTRLFGYMFKEHWMWLAVWWALPIDFFVFRFQYQRWSWVPVLFIGLLALGWLLRARRNEWFTTELQRQSSLWERLLPLGVLDLLTLNYWPIQRDG